MPFTLVAIPFDQTTPNLIDPSDNGALIHTLSPGQYADITILWTLQPDNPAQTGINASADADALSIPLAVVSSDNNLADPANEIAQAVPFNALDVPSAIRMPSTVKAILPTGLFLFCFSTSTPVTSLAGECLLKIYS